MPIKTAKRVFPDGSVVDSTLLQQEEQVWSPGQGAEILYVPHRGQINIGLTKSPFEFSRYILWKNLNEFFGQLNK